MPEAIREYIDDAMATTARRADRPAIMHGDRVLRFADLMDEVHRLAHGLEALGLRRGDGLGLLAANPPEALTIRFAAFLLGLRFTAVHLGPTTQGLAHIMRDAELTAVVFDPVRPAPGGPVPQLAAGIPHVLSLDDMAALAAEQSVEPVSARARDSDIAKLTYTGGTTGLPKGVPTTYGRLLASYRSWGFGDIQVPDDLRLLAVTPTAHATGDMAIGMLMIGVAVELHDEFDADAVLGSLASGQVATYLYPSLLYRLLDHPATATTDLSNLVLLSYGSAPASPSRLRQALDRLGPVLQQTYASTEAPAIAMLYPHEHKAELLSSVGRPLPGVRVDIRSADGRSLPVGGVGEVCVQSSSVMAGYWRRPGETAMALRDGWLYTGDLGRLDEDGYLYLVGRVKDMIIVDGHNCYAAPIEHALTSHPGVRHAAVVGAPSERTGEEMHAFVVCEPEAVIDTEQLRAAVHEQLTAVDVPAAVWFVDALPLTTFGKPDKAALRAMIRSG
ncbi:MAG: AMP-binding protein [Kutzneria sp.]|nr:AMP-binding protein [Kutzneria sp.]MBV9847917.1 AMP-binding protein [Kutzneria sp.]